MTRFAVISSLLLLLAQSPTVCAQTVTGNETFRVVVPGVVSITATTPLAEITHDETDNVQVFPEQDWSVTCGSARGALVTFETNRAFTNTGNPTQKRNARITLKKNGAPGWRITTKNDQTDYGAGDELAVVQAESNRAGPGSFFLLVEFLEESYADLESGNYEMTVTGTITAK